MFDGLFNDKGLNVKPKILCRLNIFYCFHRLHSIILGIYIFFAYHNFRNILFFYKFKTKKNVANLFRRLSTRSESTSTSSKTADKDEDEEEVVKSKQLVKNRTKNGPLNTTTTTTTTTKRTKSGTPAIVVGSTNRNRTNISFLSELERKLQQTPSTTTSNHGLNSVPSTRSHLHPSFHGDNSEGDDCYGDIDDVTSEMIRLTEEEARKDAR